jgi:hypothetical protein
VLSTASSNANNTRFWNVIDVLIEHELNTTSMKAFLQSLSERAAVGRVDKLITTVNNGDLLCLYCVTRQNCSGLT